MLGQVVHDTVSHREVARYNIIVIVSAVSWNVVYGGINLDLIVNECLVTPSSINFVNTKSLDQQINLA
jgi:hypothetical protein